jgi:hypothetical protein
MVECSIVPKKGTGGFFKVFVPLFQITQRKIPEKEQKQLHVA